MYKYPRYYTNEFRKEAAVLMLANYEIETLYDDYFRLVQTRPEILNRHFEFKLNYHQIAYNTYGFYNSLGDNRIVCDSVPSDDYFSEPEDYEFDEDGYGYVQPDAVPRMQVPKELVLSMAPCYDVLASMEDYEEESDTMGFKPQTDETTTYPDSMGFEPQTDSMVVETQHMLHPQFDAPPMEFGKLYNLRHGAQVKDEPLRLAGTNSFRKKRVKDRPPWMRY